MRIAIHSQSRAVTRTLAAILQAGGHTLADPGEAELVLYDTQHPSTDPLPNGPRLTLSATATAIDGELACPFTPHLLLQRLAALTLTPAVTLAHGWLLDATARLLTHEETRPVSLTEKEAELLNALAGTFPAAIPRETLLADIWGLGSDIDTHTLETHIYRLRAKLSSLSPTPGDIETRDGAYRLLKSML